MSSERKRRNQERESVEREQIIRDFLRSREREMRIPSSSPTERLKEEEEEER